MVLIRTQTILVWGPFVRDTEAPDQSSVSSVHLPSLSPLLKQVSLKFILIILSRMNSALYLGAERGFGNFGRILPLEWWDEGSVMFDCAESMDRQTEVKARSRNRRRVRVRCTSLGCSVLYRVLACRVVWEEGAGIRLGKGWVRARDMRMCVVSEVGLRVRGVVGRRGAGTGSGR